MNYKKTFNLSEITVAILAGGLGTRLQSVIKDQPKVLAEVNGHPFLEYLLNQIDSAGFKEVVICVGYLGDQIKNRFGEKYKNLNLSYSYEQSLLGTAGGLRLALPFLKSETILVLNGDSFCDVNLKDFLDFHLDKKANASLVLSEINDTSRYGKVTLDKNDQIIGFKEKREGNSGPGLINAGIYLINHQLISKLPPGVLSLEKEVFPKWIGQSFYGYKTNTSFIDVGTLERYKKAEEFFAKFNI